MKITADVSVHVFLDDGTDVYVSHKVPVRTELGEVVDVEIRAREALAQAQLKVLAGLAAQLPTQAEAENGPDGVHRVVYLLDDLGAPDHVSVAVAKEKVREYGADPLANDAEWREAVRRRLYRSKPTDRVAVLLSVLDLNGVPRGSDPGQCAAALRAADAVPVVAGGFTGPDWVDAAVRRGWVEPTGARPEDRGVYDWAPKGPEPSEDNRVVDAIVGLLDQADAHANLSVEDAKEALRGCGLPLPNATFEEWYQAAACHNVRKAVSREEPER
jgi:hypothetical protein